jgi:hypothetical protein
MDLTEGEVIFPIPHYRQIRRTIHEPWFAANALGGHWSRRQSRASVHAEDNNQRPSRDAANTYIACMPSSWRGGLRVKTSFLGRNNP